MIDQERTPEEIEDRAKLLCAVAFDIHGPLNKTWEKISAKQQEGFRRLARAVPGVVHIESAEAGSYPTAPQADTIRDLREKHKKRHPDLRERSWIAGGTRPYGDMVVLFEWPRNDHPTFQGYAYIVHPDGHGFRLDTSKIADSYVKVEG